MGVFWWLLGLVFVLWLGFNWIAPFAILLRAVRISPGRLPRELFVWKEARTVRFYVADLGRGYGYSVWAPPLNMVVFDRQFFECASLPLVRFVVAHELAHFALGHHRKRWLMVVGGLALLPGVRRWFQRFEDEADAEASRRTGLSRSSFLELGDENVRTDGHK